MPAPTVGTGSTDTLIVLDWSTLSGTAAGNSDILSYNVYWDNGSGTVNIELTDSLVTTLNVVSVTGGTTYQF